MPTINEYLAGCPHEVQSILQKIPKTLRAAAPKAEEKICYQIPAVTRKGARLTYFTAA